MVALIGASGSGKSTLIRHVAGLIAGDRGAAGGEVAVFGDMVQARGRVARDVAKVRRRLGVIFQQFNLAPRLSVMTNVLAGRLGRMSPTRGALMLFNRDEKRQAVRALRRVGIEHTARQRAATLSGGQQQRAAIARALVQEAEAILADEPIASLDPSSAKRVMETLAEINRSEGVAVLVSLHQVEYARRYCPRTIAMSDGRVVFDGPSRELTAAFLREIYGEASEELILPDADLDASRRRAFAGARLNPPPNSQRRPREMKSIAKFAAYAALAAGLAGPALAERENPDELFFGILSTESSSAQREKWGPFLEAMEASIGRPVKPFFASDYAGVIEGMRFDKVDVVWYGNKSAMVAVDRAGAEIFAQTTEATGDQGYWSVMVVHKDSGLTYEDVMKCDKSLDFGIGDPNSTSGFLVPSTFIFAKEGVNPKDCFKTVRNANHETNLISVATQQVDAAVASSTGMYSRLKKGKPGAVRRAEGSVALAADRLRPDGLASRARRRPEGEDPAFLHDLRPPWHGRRSR